MWQAPTSYDFGNSYSRLSSTPCFYNSKEYPQVVDSINKVPYRVTPDFGSSNHKAPYRITLSGLARFVVNFSTTSGAQGNIF